MDDARYYLLSHAAFAHDEHAQVGGGHLQCHVEGAVQAVVVANDAVALFYFL